MTRTFVLDAATALGWCFGDEGGVLCERALLAATHGQAVVPAVWPLEVGNAILRAERRQRLSAGEAQRVLAKLAVIPVAVDLHSVQAGASSVWQLARKYSLSSYDASYLELAVRLGLPLATSDAALLRAMAVCGVTLF